MGVMDQFWDAWNTANKDKIMTLLTDDVVWSWLDSAKNFPVFLPEGRYGGQGKAEVSAMFDNNPVQWGYSGYPVWSEVRGDKVFTIEVWQSAAEREVDVPLIAKSTYTIRDGKIAEWVWNCSPESSNRITFTPNTLEANRQLITSNNEDIWNQGNLDLIDERYASDYVRHQAGYPPEPAGAEGIKQFIQISPMNVIRVKIGHRRRVFNGIPHSPASRNQWKDGWLRGMFNARRSSRFLVGDR